MARVKLDLPERFIFNTEVAVRITDINYGGHVGNDAILSIIHEARVRCLSQYGYSEGDIEGAGLIMTDVIIVYKSEAFYGDVFRIDVAINEISRSGCDFFFRISESTSGREVARAKTGVVFFDYKRRKVVGVPSAFREKVDSA